MRIKDKTEVDFLYNHNKTSVSGNFVISYSVRPDILGREMALIKAGWQRSKMAKAIPSDRISQLYPCVDETETPLPRSWSSRERCQSITLSQNNLRVQYKGKRSLCLHTFVALS